GEVSDYYGDLFEELRHLRKKIAVEKAVPPYVIFSDATLKDMARYLPMTKESLLNIKGVGERKYDQYGEAFLKVLQNWQEEHPNKKGKISISQPETVVRKQKTADTRPSHLISYELFQSGKMIKEI